MDITEGPLKNLPVVIQPLERREPFVVVSDLSPAERSKLWAHLKANHREVAESLKALRADQAIAGLIEDMDASFIVPKSLCP